MFVVDFMIPVTEDYIAITNWIRVSGDMEKTLTVVLLTWFKVLSQELFGVTTEKQENSQSFVVILDGI
jgi:hypothetical protein